MARYEKATKDVHEMALAILCDYETHKPLLDAKTKIDIMFAFGDEDAEGNKSDALKHHGCKALGVARKISEKDRVAGRGDCEVTLDGDWWESASDPDRRALLDHELHHFVVKTDDDGIIQKDDAGRPIIKMRKHDFEFGWFNVIAARHGKFSQECKQAEMMMEGSGQLYWPTLAKVSKKGQRELVSA